MLVRHMLRNVLGSMAKGTMATGDDTEVGGGG